MVTMETAFLTSYLRHQGMKLKTVTNHTARLIMKTLKWLIGMPLAAQIPLKTPSSLAQSSICLSLQT